MAEEPKNPTDDSTQGEAPQKKGKKGLLFGFLAPLLAVAGAYLTTVLIPPLDQPRQVVKKKMQKGYVALAESLNGNLVGDKFRHMYSLNIAFEFEAVDRGATEGAFEDDQQLSRLKSRLNSVIARQTREDLYTGEFRQALLEAANDILFTEQEGEFTDILLTNIVIQ